MFNSDHMFHKIFRLSFQITLRIVIKSLKKPNKNYITKKDTIARFIKPSEIDCPLTTVSY